MAVMHPVDIENYDYTPTEKELYYALKEQLPDKYQVFYSVRWFETVENKRIDSESDFLVFDPSFGFITIEVKGGTGITVNDGKWTLIDNLLFQCLLELDTAVVILVHSEREVLRAMSGKGASFHGCSPSHSVY